MAQAFNVQGKPALGKDSIGKLGPVAGGVVSLIGLFFVGIGFILEWVKVKGGDSLTGLEILTKDDGAGFRGSSMNGLLCNLPFLLCGIFIVAIILIAGAFLKKAPPMAKMAAPFALGIFTLFACCPALIFMVDMLTGDPKDFVDLRFGFFLSLFGLALAFLGGIAGVGVSIAGGGLPKRNRS